jgi:rhodanese-related sulfurtransferase
MDAEVQRITKEALKLKMDNREDFLLIDVRNPADFEKSGVRLKGAVRVPLSEIEKRLPEFDRDKEVIAYCT